MQDDYTCSPNPSIACNARSGDTRHSTLPGGESASGSVLSLTPDAVVRVEEWLDQQDADHPCQSQPAKKPILRIAVQPGGCRGLRYEFFLDARQLDGDLVIPFSRFDVRVDRASQDHLEDAVLGWDGTLQKQTFTIDNRKAASSCACGDSFS